MFDDETELDRAIATNENAASPAGQDVCLTNKPPKAVQLYKCARNAINRLDDFVNGVDLGTKRIAHRALKAAVYFAIHAHTHPQEAEALEGWAEAKPKANSNPFLHPIYYAGRSVRSRDVQAKFTAWAAIAQDVHAHAIPESDFLDVVKRKRGIDQWYRSISKSGGKGGRPKANPNATTRARVAGDKPAAGGRKAPSVPQNPANPYLSPLVMKAANDGRELVAVVLDITQSATFSFDTVKQRWRVLPEYVDVVGIANLGGAA